MYFSINNTDMSAFLTENSFSCETLPVYDSSAEYINARGQKVLTRTGTKTVISAELSGVTEAAARVLRSAFGSETASVRIFAPDSEVMTVRCEGLTLELTGNIRTGENTTEKIFRAKLRMCSETLDGL